jgi:hypothetical protein
MTLHVLPLALLFCKLRRTKSRRARREFKEIEWMMMMMVNGDDDVYQ